MGENSIVERKEYSLWFYIFKKHKNKCKLNCAIKGCHSGWAKLTNYEPKTWMALARRHSCHEHSDTQASYMNSMLYPLQAGIFLKGKGREANINAGLTTCSARGVHILDVFKSQCKPVVYISFHWTSQTGKGEPTYSNHILSDGFFLLLLLLSFNKY